MYKQGGIFSVTSRILVTDMLTDLIDCPKISGVVVLHSERLTPNFPIYQANGK